MLLNRFFAPIATAVFLSAPAALFAQTPPWGLPSATERYSRANDAQVSYYDARRIAYDQGYREGVKEGEKDARRGDRSRYQDEREFQRGDRGYNRSFGDRERYRQIFRDGYSSGYSDAFSRYSRYGRNDGRYRRAVRPGALRPARSLRPARPVRCLRRFLRLLQPGIRQRCARGLREGPGGCAQGAQLRRPPASWYRAGDRHYESRYGSREQYKDVYRRGFQQGYEQGFRDWRYYWQADSRTGAGISSSARGMSRGPRRRPCPARKTSRGRARPAA